MTVAILRSTPAGKRLFPISKSDAEEMVRAGTAVCHNGSLYQEQHQVPSAQHGGDTYHTKVMVAETPKRRRKGNQ